MSPSPPTPPHGPTSALAIAALVVAVLPGCPLVNLIGMGLGVLALRRIRVHPVPLGGRRIARLAVILGWLSLVLWTGVWWWAGGLVRDALQETMVADVRQTLLVSDEAAATAALTRWMPTDPATPEPAAVLEFANSIRARYGALERVSVTSMNADRAFAQPTYRIAMILFFEDQQRPASARFRVPVGRIRPGLERLVLVDAVDGDLVLGGD